ncbi:MAG: hypothetical protein KGL18_01345 [Burkholderiales bacterium]|nr:hypothetical protein [Burkholderiales bacterium]
MTPTLDVLRRRPYNLGQADLDWVELTLAGLPRRRRLAQLFNVMLRPRGPEFMARLQAEQPGGVTQFMLGGPEAALPLLRSLADACELPLLVSGDVEGGAIGLAGSSPMSNQLGMAAMADAALYERAVEVMAREARALGINWSFTPVLDINAEFRSAIVATRSYGSDPALIGALAAIHVDAMQRNGVAATAKHWPGEGYDARDQHLVTTLNPLGIEAWHARFGALYRRLIDAGVLSIMSAHIAWPAYARARGVSGLEACRPASVSRLLNLELLRGELGFNGLIVSDASSMAGLASWGSRARVLPELIENGCDMVLFGADLGADLDLMEAALDEGRLSAARVDEALVRVLGLKAVLGLHRADIEALAPSWQAAQAAVQTPAHRAVSEAVAAAGATLVKDVRALLPISPQRQRHVLLVTDPRRRGFGPIPPLPLVFDRLLQEQGFEVTVYDPQSPPEPARCDLTIFLLAQESLLTLSHIYLDWAAMLGPLESAMKRDWHDQPCMLVSFGQPYYLYDAPRMPCVINAYTATEPMQRAVVRKLVGLEPFSGVSPVDAFCGLPDAHY